MTVDTKFTPDARAVLIEQGWCVVPDVIASDVAAEGVRRLWAAAESNAREGYSCFLPAIDPHANMVRIMSPLWSDPWFRQLIQNPTALEAAGAVVEGALAISNCTANIALPGSGPMALHSDLASILPEPWHHPWSVNVIWCLTDVRPDNGATRYIPGSHRWRTRADIPVDATDQLRPFEARAGSIILMDGRLWHTSGNNVTRDEARALLFAYYSSAFLRPMVNWTALFPAEEQAGFSPLLRALFGLDVFANTIDSEQAGQGHWRGMPVGAEQALADFRAARAASVRRS